MIGHAGTSSAVFSRLLQPGLQKVGYEMRTDLDEVSSPDDFELPPAVLPTVLERDWRRLEMVPPREVLA